MWPIPRLPTLPPTATDHNITVQFSLHTTSIIIISVPFGLGWLFALGLGDEGARVGRGGGGVVVFRAGREGLVDHVPVWAVALTILCRFGKGLLHFCHEFHVAPRQLFELAVQALLSRPPSSVPLAPFPLLLLLPARLFLGRWFVLSKISGGGFGASIDFFRAA